LAATNVSRREAERKLAFVLIDSINEVTPVSPLSLIATAILGYHRKGFLYSELTDTSETSSGSCKSIGFPVNSLKDLSSAVQETLTLLINWKVVETLEGADGDEESFYFVEDEKKIELEYYKNSILHHFLNHTLVAASLLAGREQIRSFDSVSSDYEFMRNCSATNSSWRRS